MNSPDGNWLRRRNSIPRGFPRQDHLRPSLCFPLAWNVIIAKDVNNHQILNILHEVSLDVSVGTSEVQGSCESPEMNWRAEKMHQKEMAPQVGLEPSILNTSDRSFR